MLFKWCLVVSDMFCSAYLSNGICKVVFESNGITETKHRNRFALQHTAGRQGAFRRFQCLQSSCSHGFQAL
jgi:hypothetical protein